ncbi:alpha-N-acetylgalactosaminidase-like [Diaphorina citri]|uniref:Alpha-N-acetylgalactosaminidase-like n=1 Tax=Diaphorina citri TaxID=121845 RepID=A0A3Q0IR75_DIACI|nr:alpha-N-acetylgalactosaminidase-like [Diaphorina citri]
MTGDKLLASSHYPDTQSVGGQINFTNLVEVCNLWRNYDDIDDSWYSVTTIANYFALKQDLWTKYAGPGHWNDPDMVR